VEFARPPVVEAWIEFKFALTQEDSQWDEDAARSLMKLYSGEFVPDSFLKCVQIDVNIRPGQSDTTARREFFDRVRAFSERKDLCIQAGRDVFVFNQIKKEGWGKYERLRDAALASVEKYMKFRDLHDLIAVSLHYRDIVVIPAGRDSRIRLNDWFRVYPEVPEDPFGTVSAFKFDLQFPNMCKDGNALLTVRSLPVVGQEDAGFKFSVDWHVVSTGKMGGLMGCNEWLDSAHGALDNSFEGTFTRQCLELFEPIKGG